MNNIWSKEYNLPFMKFLIDHTGCYAFSSNDQAQHQAPQQ